MDTITEEELKIDIGTKILIGNNLNTEQYFIEKVIGNVVYLKNCVDRLSYLNFRRTIENLNLFLLSRTYKVIDTTPEIEAKIGVWNNIVKARDFKRLANPDNIMGYDNQYASKITIDKHAVKTDCYLNISPTGNCQIASLAFFNVLVYHSSNLSDQLKEIYSFTEKTLLLIDVEKYVYEKMLTLIDKNIIHLENRYVSSNGSNMVLCLLNLKAIK